MKSIVQYINESAGFSQYTSSFDEVLTLCPSMTKKITKHLDIIKNYIQDVLDATDNNPEEIFIYNPATSYIKMYPSYNDTLDKIANLPEYADIVTKQKEGDYSLSVYYKNTKFIQTGSGSIGRVDTASQETATCLVWNVYIEQLKNNPEFVNFNTDEIKEMVKDISEDFDTEWITTFQKQIVSIYEYLKTINVNPLDYRLCRYKEKQNSDKHIGLTYAKFIDTYTSNYTDKYTAKKGGQKDNFDQSDVIAFNVNKISEINSVLGELTNLAKTDTTEARKVYEDKLFDKKLTIGISLKKIAGNKSKAEYDTFNTMNSENRIGNITSFEIKDRKYASTKNIQIDCFGTFNFNKTTEPGSLVEIHPVKVIRLTMRTFGNGGNVAIDATIPTGKNPSLGKCPARIWRSIINAGKSDWHNIDNCIEKFNQFLQGDKKDVLDDLTNLIKYSVKEGKCCFPFVLLH